MKKLFLKLSLTSMKSNRKYYIPYILSAVVSVMLFYTINYLAFYEVVPKNYDGINYYLQAMQAFDCIVGIFTAIFLMYSYSFLYKQKTKEYGIYNILGMSKNNLVKFVILDVLIIGMFSIGVGLFLGIIFAKFADLLLRNLMHYSINYDFAINTDAMLFTIICFGIIFLLILIKSIISIYVTKVENLISNNKADNRPVRANWVCTVLGVIVLAIAYYISVTSTDYYTVMSYFFIAVIMVIGGCFMLFMSGSVTLYKVLQKSKKYFYKKNHFVFTSIMAHRMKRNGTGLATICILSTMVLVLISSTASIYIGIPEMIKKVNPHNDNICINIMDKNIITDNNTKKINDVIEKEIKKEKVITKNTTNLYLHEILGKVVDDNTIKITNGVFQKSQNNYNISRHLTFISLEDYNRITKSNYRLSKNEVLLSCTDCEYKKKFLNINAYNGNVKFKIKQQIPLSLKVTSNYFAQTVFKYMYIIVPNIATIKTSTGKNFIDNDYLATSYYYGFDYSKGTGLDYMNTYNALDKLKFNGQKLTDSVVVLEKQKNSLNRAYMYYGIMLSVGVLLSFIFVFALTIIIYYKQVAEGYEDRKKFKILQRLGMSNEDIKKNIKSQIIKVFYTPLIVAGINLVFAFPILYIISSAVLYSSTKIMALTSIITFVAFAILYSIIYLVTARSYYKIVIKDSKVH